MRAFVSFLALLVGVAAFAQSGFINQGLGSGNAVQWRGFRSGSNSQIQNFTTRVLINEGDWQGFWRQLTGDSPANAPRGIDWNKNQLVAVVLGNRSSGGYGVRILSVVKENSRDIVVRYTEVQPPAGSASTSAITSPYDVISVERTAGNFRFEKVETPAFGSWPKVTETGPGLGYGDIVPLPWSPVASGTTSSLTDRPYYVISTREQYELYMQKVGRINFPPPSSFDRDIFVAIHIDAGVANGTNIGIEKVLLNRAGEVLICWYRDLQFAQRGGRESYPFVIVKIPRYTTSPIVRQVSAR